MKINPSDTSLVIFQSYLLVSDQCAAFGSREWLKWDQVVWLWVDGLEDGVGEW